MDVMDDSLTWGRAICGELATAERREWLCTNGMGGFASGTVAGAPTRRYHGLLVAALRPPLGRTVLGAQVHETVSYDGRSFGLATSRWADGTVDSDGYRLIESFRLDGTSPAWTYACDDALVDKRIWMEPGASTTYVRYGVRRARGPVTLRLQVLVNHRDYHAVTRAGDWRMDVTAVPAGVRVTPFAGAPPILALAADATARPEHDWYRDFHLLREAERGLDHLDDALHAVSFETTLAPGGQLTLVVSAEPAPSLDGEAAWQRRRVHDSRVVHRWESAQPAAATAPGWIRQLVLAADQFVVQRASVHDPGGLTVMAGYHWFGDWGRDTMIALPGLVVTTGHPAAARTILATFARFVDRGMLPNRFPDAGDAPEYNSVDAALWYIEAIRAYLAATDDDGLLEELFGALEGIVAWYREGTRYGIRTDRDGLLAAGEPGMQLTWMDAKVGDQVVTPRTGKAVEINALWYNALRAMAGFAARLRRPAGDYSALADRVTAGFERFWYARGGYCHDVVDTPTGDDPTLRPNQILAVSLPESPLSPERQRAVVAAVASRLLTEYGLRSLTPDHPEYQGHYGGDPAARDGAYHQGTVWSWLLGPFALAHFRVHRDRDAARSFLSPIAGHLGDYGVGSIAEIVEGDPPFRPAGCIAQAWSVAEVLRAWHELDAER
jgi:predicted glycogen debranching enzyme